MLFRVFEGFFDISALVALVSALDFISIIFMAGLETRASYVKSFESSCFENLTSDNVFRTFSLSASLPFSYVLVSIATKKLPSFERELWRQLESNQ